MQAATVIHPLQQSPQAESHIPFTPSKSQRLSNFFFTHLHFLTISFPFGDVTGNADTESKQVPQALHVSGQ